VVRRILALAVLGMVVLAGAAGAAGNGKYLGKSDLKFSGGSVFHPFGLTVRHGKVTNVSLFAGSNCAGLNGAAGIGVKFKIDKHDRFSGTLKFARFDLKFKGAFKGKVVTGSFAGTAKGLTSSCPVPKNTFKATR
jgi:hypothetical protein